jgi:MFS transporter, DHA1 family, multidrug resistance protein
VGSVFEFNERRVIYSFQSKRHWHPGQASLPFLAILVGIIIAIFLLSIFNRTWWLRRHNANGKAMAADRIPPMIVGISLLLGGLVWFGWTSNPQVAWLVQVFSSIFIGCGTILIHVSYISTVRRRWGI